MGTDGSFYGATAYGGNGRGCGSIGCGTVFKITTRGVLTTLHSLSYDTEGDEPFGGVIQATDGSFYGTAYDGGAYNCGTVFRITHSGSFTTMHSFDCSDGQFPVASLTQATDGNFYGTTQLGGGAKGQGTVFRITPGGILATLHTFTGSDGDELFGGVVQSTNGILYGTTNSGGTGGYGTIFSENVGLGPFVRTLPGARKVGQGVIILGNNLSGSSKVMFNGTAAMFTIVSNTEIATTVPYGAKTGTVQVTTPSGTLSSNVPFQVTQ